MSTKEAKMPALRAGGIMQSIIPQDVNEAFRLAKMAFQAGMLKKQKVKRLDDYGRATYEEEDDEAVVARGTMQVLQGLEIGMPPMQALQLIALVGSRLVVHSEGIPAILWSKGFKLNEWQEDEGTDKWTAHCELTRPDGTVIKRSFSVKQAIKAKLWSPAEKLVKRGKTGTYETENDSAWHRFEFRMLMHRARGYAANDGGADALRGIGVRELVEDAHTIDVTPKPVPLAVPDDITGDDEPAAATVSEAESDQDALIADEPAYLERLKEQLETVETRELFDECWAAHEQLVEAGRISRDGQLKAESLHEETAKRWA